MLLRARLCQTTEVLMFARILSIWSVGNAVVNSPVNHINTSLYGGIQSNLVNAMACILVCRFFLQLRKYNYKAEVKRSRNISITRIRDMPQYVSHTLMDNLGDGDLYQCTKQSI
ncbi:hypothetical protein M422DRAFT_250337 [Sphaerobolus stellatus SS14]|uniref:Unplaced genomic scaffold SPHSTscaffold_33, whole genome shotgun sequence n=1 Tax=Sphaerobolus stellatus (strain SS14) TaxID=990650 RepID=A0A0C9W4H1_SPHS4|nr:hypothetical protein M422DRAFT_250337 [Sphaerobolus stellatus SS14]